MKGHLREAASAGLAAVMAVSLLSVTACTNKKDDSGKGTPESTYEPAKNVDDLFVKGDKEYYTPFQNPDHCYCTISDGLGTPVRSQGLGGCYSYAAVSTMQSSFLKENGELIDINPVDLIHRIYTYVDPDTKDKESAYSEEKYYPAAGPSEDLGGDISRVTAVMCADPLNGYLITETNIYDIEGELSIDEIKALIREHGALCISCDYQKGCKELHGYRTQNNPLDDPDHVATVVGWDDDFPADCFANPASQNGAWLVQNSFGITYGNYGYYWISYDQKISEISGSEVSNEYSSAISYGRFAVAMIPAPEGVALLTDEIDATDFTAEQINTWSDMTVATVYEKKGSIGAVGFWTTYPGQPYRIEIREGEFGDIIASANGSFDHIGYHTVKLDNPVSVKKFTVIVSTTGMAVFEGQSTEVYTYKYSGKVATHYEAKTEPGRSFIEIDGGWVDVTDPQIVEKLGFDKFEESSELTSPGDPCITVLFM